MQMDLAVRWCPAHRGARGRTVFFTLIVGSFDVAEFVATEGRTRQPVGQRVTGANDLVTLGAREITVARDQFGKAGLGELLGDDIQVSFQIARNAAGHCECRAEQQNAGHDSGGAANCIAWCPHGCTSSRSRNSSVRRSLVF